MAKVNLKNVRLCFLHAFERAEPKKNGEKAAYKVCILLDKDDQQVEKLEDTALEVLTAKWGKREVAERWMSRNYARDSSKECAVNDGDLREEVTPVFENAIYINARSPKQPKIQTSLGEDQTEPGITVDGDPIEGKEIYAGCYANVSIELWAQDNEHGKGLRAAILGLRFRADGEAFGGGGSTATDDDLSDDNDEPRSVSRRRSRDDEDDAPRGKSRNRRDRDEDEDDEPRERRRSVSRRRSRDDD